MGCCQGRGWWRGRGVVSHVLAVRGTRAFAMRETQNLDKKEASPELEG